MINKSHSDLKVHSSIEISSFSIGLVRNALPISRMMKKDKFVLTQWTYNGLCNDTDRYECSIPVHILLIMKWTCAWILDQCSANVIRGGRTTELNDEVVADGPSWNDDEKQNAFVLHSSSFQLNSNSSRWSLCSSSETMTICWASGSTWCILDAPKLHLTLETMNSLRFGHPKPRCEASPYVVFL